MAYKSLIDAYSNAIRTQCENMRQINSIVTATGGDAGNRYGKYDAIILSQMQSLLI